MTFVGKIFIVLVLLWISTAKLHAQNSIEDQFNYAKKLFEEEKYFDAVTEFKRLLLFDESGNYNFEANKLIGLAYKYGGKFSDALQHFTLAEMYSSTDDEIYECRIETVKINILRRTTQRALTILDSLENNSRFSNQIDEINYWRGWVHIFSDDWSGASAFFSLSESSYQLSNFCDSLANELYDPSLAKYLSFIPGAGQFYTGEYVSGLISIGWNVLWGYLTINAFTEDRVFDGFLVGSLLWWRFYSGNIQNAEKFAIEKNLEKTNSALRFLQNDFKGRKP